MTNTKIQQRGLAAAISGDGRFHPIGGGRWLCGGYDSAVVIRTRTLRALVRKGAVVVVDRGERGLYYSAFDYEPPSMRAINVRG